VIPVDESIAGCIFARGCDAIAPAMHFRLLALARVCSGLLLTVASGVAAELRVVGTDLLGVDFSKALYESAGRRDVPLALALDGSRPGLDQLKSGRAELALLVLPPGEERLVAEFETATLAYHRVLVLVPAASPLAQISVGQLGGVFGTGGSTGYTRWGELGLAGDWAGSAIASHAPAAGAGPTAEFFRAVVLHGGSFKSNVGRYDSLAELAPRLSGDSRAIALAAAPLPEARAGKIVPVSLRAGEPAYLPTPENLHSGDYPLRLPLQVVFRRESRRTVQPLLRFLFSDEAAPLLDQAGLVPLPAAARHQQQVALDKP